MAIPQTTVLMLYCNAAFNAQKMFYDFIVQAKSTDPAFERSAWYAKAYAVLSRLSDEHAEAQKELKDQLTKSEIIKKL